MEEVRQLVQEEGREARNLVAFHVAVDTPARFARKPPRAQPLPRRAPPRPPASRLRSASAGRDKRSELRARYWALLFGDLQRAIGEIYNTVEAHENLNECQEVILVLENYTRDFKALGEWFRLKWEYDNTPPPQRPQSLAWEIRKTDFVRPESRRTHSVKSSPSVSGKNSPCLSGHNTPSGKNSPSLTGKASPGSGKISPRVSSGHSTSPKANIEFFSNKIAAASKVTAKPEPKLETKLTEIKEKDVNSMVDVIEENDEKVSPVLQVQGVADETVEVDKLPAVELGKAKQCPNAFPKPVVVKSTKSKVGTKSVRKDSTEELSAQAKTTKATLDAMENDFLTKQLVENKARNENMMNQDFDVEKQIAKSSSEDKPVQNETTVEEKNSCNVVDLDPLKDNCISKIEQAKPNDEVIKNSVPSSDVVHDIEMNGKIDTPIEKDSSSSESPSKSDDNFADISNESSIKSVEDKREKVDDILEFIVEEKSETDPKSMEKVQDNGSNAGCTAEKKTPIDLLKENVESSKDKEPTKNKDDCKDDKDFKKPEPKVETKLHVKPAYSQAAAKPKVTPVKTEIKTPTRATPLIRSKTAVEIRSNTAPKIQRQCPKRNITSKCSYPFNLTTGRPSLFDTSSNVANKGAVPKKVVNKNVLMGSGDAKVNQPKLDPKKRPLRPTTLKVNEKGDKKEKANPALGKMKDCDEYSSSDTIVTQIDMSRIESSESLRTLVPDDLEVIHDAANSVEVLNVDSNKNDNDGWLTVKSRRLSRESKKHSKSHWANRFHQPSATTSLPTLNMIESPKQEVKPIIHAPVAPKVDRAKSEQPQTVKPEKVATARNRADTRRNLDMIRQKSDVTGLKRSARSKALQKKAEKAKDSLEDADSSELTKNRLHSSLESLTTGLARSQESTEEAFDFDKWKAEFKSTLKYLEDDDQLPNHNEILKTADPSEMSEIAEMTSQIEENEKKISWALDFQAEVDQRKLSEEEDLLNRQIMELQQVSDIDLDTETDDTETDAEILCEEISVPPPENLGSLAASLEDQYETALAGMSWAERVDTLVVLEALVARDPGRAQQLHAKLSQGIKRRGSFQDALRRLQAKQARAERQRLEYQTERAKKIHQLLARVEEVKVAKNQLIEEKRMRMERRLQKAAENRDQHLKDIVRKAHDEEEKLREIAFIKQLEAENRRHEFLDQCSTHTTRLRRVRRDRLNKLEQKAAREAAVGARRQAIEAARQRHVQTLLERRKERDRRIDGLREMRRQERDIAAREKVTQAIEAARQRHVQTLLERRKERDRRIDGLREMRRQERDIAAREKVTQAIEAARQRHVQTLLERRKERDRRIDGLREMRRQERDIAAREKVTQAIEAARQRHVQTLLERRKERDRRIDGLREMRRQERDIAAREKVTQAIEAARQRHVQTLLERRKERDRRIDGLREMRRQERDIAAREKVTQAIEAARQRHVQTLLERRKERDRRIDGLREMRRQERDIAAREKVTQAIEAARQRHVQTLLERRKERDRRIDGLREMRRQERDIAAREKVTQAIEAARQRHVQTLLERRKERDRRIDGLREMRRQERDIAAREKVTQAIEAARQRHVQTLLERRKERDRRIDGLREMRRQERDIAAREKVTQAIEAARQRHVQTLLERRKERDRRIDGLREMRRQERDIAAREKAEGVKSRLSALAAAAELEAVALRSRIRHKQDASQQRLESHLQAIREKATGPRQPTTSESQENDCDEAARLELERKERDKIKALKKKARKVKQKLLAGGNEQLFSENRVPIDPYTFPVANKMYKVVQQINNILAPLVEQKPPHTEETEEKLNGEDTENKKPKKKKAKKDASENNNNTEVTGTVEEVKESKKSKKKKKEDRAKLGNTESVCSSLSDMSRASGKSEKKNKVAIDMQYLERLLNELLRMLEKSDTAPDKAMFKKLQGPKTIGQLLSLAADRDDLTHQFTTKCLSTAVMISSRGLATSSESARYLINTNTCVYIVKLLSMQVEKDLSDPREAELACLLADWVSLALDSTLQEDRATNQATRARGHMLISYICLSGILRADTRGEVRAGIQTLVTVCCDLCTPYENHHSPECFAASQSLHVALGRGLCGARADFCLLFARGANLAECGGFVRAARTSHLLRTIAQLDHQLVQESFMEGGYALEFRAAVARLLTQHAPSEKEAPRTQAHTQNTMRLDHSLSETMVLDLIILIGFMVVNNPQLQETICNGWSVIKMLCTLPANWLVSRAHSHALLPTLTALAEHPPAALAIRAELSPQMLDDYMDSPEAQKVKLVQVIKQGRAKKLATKN